MSTNTSTQSNVPFTGVTVKSVAYKLQTTTTSIMDLVRDLELPHYFSKVRHSWIIQTGDSQAIIDFFNDKD